MTLPAASLVALAGASTAQPEPPLRLTASPARGTVRTTPSAPTVRDESRTARLVRLPTMGGSGAKAVSTTGSPKRSTRSTRSERPVASMKKIWGSIMARSGWRQARAR